MSEFAPWMFLVKIENGKKPRVCRVAPYEVLGWEGSSAATSRRTARAWPAPRANAVAAIGNTVDEAYALIEKLEVRRGT